MRCFSYRNLSGKYVQFGNKVNFAEMEIGNLAHRDLIAGLSHAASLLHGEERKRGTGRSSCRRKEEVSSVSCSG